MVERSVRLGLDDTRRVGPARTGGSQSSFQRERQVIGLRGWKGCGCPGEGSVRAGDDRQLRPALECA
jgi:hypothetical protein